MEVGYTLSDVADLLVLRMEVTVGTIQEIWRIADNMIEDNEDGGLG